MAALLAYGAYLPRYRLPRMAVSTVLGGSPLSGARTVAGYDEDSTSMAVEAARAALDGVGDRSFVHGLYFATASPAYADKTNATAIHAALQLDSGALAVDFGGAVRSGVGALSAAASATGAALAVVSDVRTGRPGGADERAGGDGAAAFLFGPPSATRPAIAEQLSSAHATIEVLERWRLPGETASRVWEERFGVEVYPPLAHTAFTEALKSADLTPDAVDHLVVTGLHERAAAHIGGALGTRPDTVRDTRTAAIGNAGTAQPGIALADVLDTAAPSAVIAVVVVADGVSVQLWRTTEALAGRRQRLPIAHAAGAGVIDVSYATFLSWRGQLHREPPRRPDPEPPYAPPSLRRSAWKFGFVGSRCTACGQRHLPPARVCSQCQHTDAMVDEPMAEVPARIATATVDRLAFTPSPPMLMVVLDYDGGGRFRCELTDASPSDAVIGAEVEMTFRRTLTAAGIHNYFWKARPRR